MQKVWAFFLQKAFCSSLCILQERVEEFMSSLWAHALDSFTELEAQVTNFLPAKISPKSVVYRRTRRTPSTQKKASMAVR